MELRSSDILHIPVYWHSKLLLSIKCFLFSAVKIKAKEKQNNLKKMKMEKIDGLCVCNSSNTYKSEQKQQL